MIRLLFALLCLGLAATSQAQFVAILGCYDAVILTSCTGGDPVDPGCFGTIYWDQNNNGVDPADQPPVVGNGFGQCNFNTIPMSSGPDLIGIPGGFATDPAFTISTTTPQPSRYYVVVDCNGVRWTSSVFTINDGLNDIDITAGWSCIVVPPQCDEPTFYVHTYPFPDPTEWFNHHCINVCAGIPIEIAVGPLSPDNWPRVTVFPGCGNLSTGCNIECPPAQFVFDWSELVYNAGERTWSYYVSPISDGCICVLEEFLPVEYAAFGAVAGDRSAVINWTTASEQDVDFFRLMRDGVQIHTVTGTNTATGSSYSYHDEGLQNGRTYHYSLAVVNIDGSVDNWPTETNATPSANLAVITEYALHQNYPNPFNPSTTITFDVVDANEVTLNIFNVNGQIVATLVSGAFTTGRHTVSFDAANLTSGLYFYSVKIGSKFTATKKMLLVK